MTSKQEYVKSLVQDLKKDHTEANVQKVAERILSTTIDNQPITEAALYNLLDLVGNQIGDLYMITEQGQNMGRIKVMQRVNEIIARANINTTNSTNRPTTMQRMPRITGRK